MVYYKSIIVIVKTFVSQDTLNDSFQYHINRKIKDFKPYVKLIILSIFQRNTEDLIRKLH